MDKKKAKTKVHSIKNNNHSISCVRNLAFLMVFVYHIFYYYQVELMMGGSIGVYVVLAISGFLDGQKELESALLFYKKRFIKILIPYYIVFVVCSFLQFVFVEDIFDKGTFVGGLLLYKQVPMGENLWLVSTLLMCYLITPILNKLKCIIKNRKSFYKISILSISLVILLYIFLNGYFRTAGIVCYVIAYFIGVNESEQYVSDKYILFSVSMIMIIGNFVGIYYLTQIYGINHISVGLFIFLTTKIFFTKITSIKKLARLISITDKYSYEAYLVHHIIILGPFSILDRVKIVPIAIIIIIFGIVVLSWLLKKITNIVYDIISKVKESNFSWGDISDCRTEIMGGSIIYIVFFHCTVDLSLYPAIALVKSFGNIGVDIFLIVSAIGLYKSLSDRKGTVLAFYKRRLMRVMPTTVICMIPWFGYLYCNGREHADILSIVLDVTSLSFWVDGNNRSWYIALTLFLYLIYPFIAFLIKQNTSLREGTVFGVLLGLSIVLNCLIIFWFPNWFGTVNLALRRIPTFILGCAIAKKVNDRRTTEVPIVLGAVLVAIGISYLLINHRSVLEIMYMWAYLYGVLAFCIIIIASYIFKVLGLVYIKKILSFFGKLTLEIYLIHTQILTVMEENLKLGVKYEKIIINLWAVIISLLLAFGVNIMVKQIGRAAKLVSNGL